MDRAYLCHQPVKFHEANAENREEHCFLILNNKNAGWTDLQENYSFFTYSQPTNLCTQ